MKKNTLRIGAALVATTALTLGPVMAANAAPWDGGYVYFQHGEWEASGDGFNMQDVYLIDPANDSTPTVYEYTDLWDGFGQFSVSFDDWSTDDEAGAASDSDIELTDDAATGDKVYSGPMTSSGMVWDGILDITGELRIFSAGDLVRQTFFVKNITSSPQTVSFEFYTDFGSSGGLWNYQGQSDAILPVPADEDSVSAAALNGAGVQWMVHSDQTWDSPGTSDCDAPGAVAFGLTTADSPATIDLYGDEYYGIYNDVVIPAGATIALAMFGNWTPDLLLADSYSGSPCVATDIDAYADAATTAAAEFDSFSGRLTNGLTGFNVINWGDLTTPEPELPNTGVDSAAVVGSVAVAVLALVGGGLVVMARRRGARA